MDRKVILMKEEKEEDVAQKIGEYVLSHFNADLGAYCKSCIIIPGCDEEFRLVSIDIQIADVREDEKAYPHFLDLETAASL